LAVRGITPGSGANRQARHGSPFTGDRSWTDAVTVSPPTGTAFVNGAALVEVEATNSDNGAVAEREIRLFWAKK
jgi:hypothetical protein